MQNNTKGVRLTRSLLNTAVLVALSAVLARPAAAADGLLETLAKKGVLSPEEYEALEQQQNTELRVDTTEGFKLTTADGAFSMQLGTLQQLDFTSYADDGSDLADGTEFRRSRLSVDGRLFKDWQYRVEYEFSGTTGVTDAYVAYTALKPFTVTIGQFKQPFGMEALTSDRTATFIERGLPFAFIITRAPGVMLGSSGRNWSANGGVFGEPVGSVQAGDEGYGLVGRLSYAPLLGASELIHLGAGVTLRKPSDDNSSNSSGPKFSTQRFRAKPESDVLAQRLVDTGEIRDVDHYSIEGLEAAGQRGAASLQGEIHFVQVERQHAPTLDFGGWYTQLAWTMTGEARPYKPGRGVFDGIRPRRNFASGGGWGAFEVAARISAIDLTSHELEGGKERNATLGLNWYLNPFLRTSANVVKVLSLKGGQLDGEKPTAFELRLQLGL